MSHILKNTTSAYTWSRYISIALLSFALLRGITIFTDPFHQGEYFASAVSFFSANSSKPLPLTIHGALDFIPAVIAEEIWGTENYFLPTLAIYKLFIFIAGVFFILITSSTIEKRQYHPWLIIAIGLLAPYLLTYRDTFLLLTLFTFLHLNNNKKSQPIRYSLQTIFGLCAAACMLWSYERGLACIISLGAATILLSLRDKTYLIALASFAATILLAGQINPALSLSFYFENIHFLLTTSSQWSYGSKPSAVIITLFALLINGLALLSYWLFIIENKKEKEDVYHAIGLTALTLIILKTSMNRADIVHLFPALSMPIILLTQGIPRNQYHPKFFLWGIVALALAGVVIGIKTLSYMPVLGMILISYLVSTAFFSPVGFLNGNRLKAFIIIGLMSELFNISSALIHGGYGWLNLLHNPPSNFHTSQKPMQWASKEIMASRSKCLFDMSNNGIINGVTNLPSCSRITYPVYATGEYENELMNAVLTSAPRAIVYSSTHESYSIDKKPMPERFPKLDKLLRDKYPYESCQLGYCVRRNYE